MKHLKIGILVCVACLSGCSSDNSQATREVEQDSIRAALQDSLANALNERDTLMALMNDIEEGVTQLKQIEDIVSADDFNGEGTDKKQQLRDDVALIQKSVEERKKRLDELEKRLKQSEGYNSDIKRTVEKMKERIASQEKTISRLNEQLEKANVKIAELNESVDSLETVTSTVKKENEALAKEKKEIASRNEQLTSQVNDLNECYYIIGSKKELKDHKIIESGFLKKTKLRSGDYEKSYFIKADRRTLSEINLHSKHAEVMTSHPEGTYTIADVGGVKVLRINDLKKFWEYTNYLVVKVE